MPGKFVISLTHGKNDTDKATVAFVVANAAVASDKDTLVFLSIEAVRLAQPGFADDIHEEGFAALKDLMANYVNAGGKIFVCSPCFKKRKLDESALIPGAAIVGGAKLVEFMGEGCPSLSY
ncbi:MAG TPA: DsrE family protein [Rubrivivax sp.]|nr:DsrE family protein [Rubrivivax sp.]